MFFFQKSNPKELAISLKRQKCPQPILRGEEMARGDVRKLTFKKANELWLNCKNNNEFLVNFQNDQ